MFNITIDGKAGCGKSTLAEKISQRLNLKNFNTGAVYRGITCEYKKRYRDMEPTEKIITDFVKELKVEIMFNNDNHQLVFVNGTNYTPYLRSEEISNFVAKISPYDIIREKVRLIQRDFASKNDCVMEGRDIGTVVLKNATCKFFVTAKNEIRAKRRFEQLNQTENAPTYDEILKEINERDFKDINREHGALLPADDAFIIDNSEETVDETVERCLQIINKKKK